MSIRDAWLELRSELKGLWWVPLAGLMGPIPMIALARAVGHWFFYLSPLPLFLASLRSAESDRSGPAIALGALLSNLTSVILPSLVVERIPLPCRACSLPFSTLLALLGAPVVIAVLLLPLLALWLVACAYPAYVASRRFRIVPRLLLIAYALALLANAALLALCAAPPPPGEDSLARSLPLLDLAASLLLGFACLWRARSGGGERLLSFLTFYALVGTYRWGA